MAGINKVIMIGRLGKDPDVMTYDNGVKRASFSLATTESYRDKEGNWQDQTEWHNVVLWRYLAEKKLVKGDLIYLEGRLRNRNWDDDKGQKHYITEIQGDKVNKLMSAGGGQFNNNASTTPPTEQANPPMPDVQDNPEDDLPF